MALNGRRSLIRSLNDIEWQKIEPTAIQHSQSALVIKGAARMSLNAIYDWLAKIF